jgi:hypothetical protein
MQAVDRQPQRRAAEAARHRADELPVVALQIGAALRVV